MDVLTWAIFAIIVFLIAGFIIKTTFKVLKLVLAIILVLVLLAGLAVFIFSG